MLALLFFKSSIRLYSNSREWADLIFAGWSLFLIAEVLSAAVVEGSPGGWSFLLLVLYWCWFTFTTATSSSSVNSEVSQKWLMTWGGLSSLLSSVFWLSWELCLVDWVSFSIDVSRSETIDLRKLLISSMLLASDGGFCFAVGFWKVFWRTV